MKTVWPLCPLNNGKSEEAWQDGIDTLLEDLKFNEQLPFKDPEEIWEEVCYILEEEDLILTDNLKTSIRKIFDQLWPHYKAK